MVKIINWKLGSLDLRLIIINGRSAHPEQHLKTPPKIRGFFLTKNNGYAIIISELDAVFMSFHLGSLFCKWKAPPSTLVA